MIQSAQEFARLRTSDDPAEYGRAAHDEAPEEVWLEVIAKYPELRTWVAHNKTVPLSILELLSNDSDSSVRSSVADKRKLSKALRRKLAQDSEASVRARIAWNAKCEVDILELLATDPEGFVREAALERLQARKNAL